LEVDKKCIFGDIKEEMKKMELEEVGANVA